ncbi:MAG: hypothetical protein LBK99_06255 [Opitutaceae bacterium]|jgi:TRAP-type C4-dicarboxylate transport system permease small subunit|nr:hypothetical protein [Opitutaceae bacterium]
MNLPSDELAAQLLFWSSLGSFPLALVAFLLAFRLPSRAVAVTALFAGSLFLSCFLWYAWNFAHGLAGNATRAYEWIPWHYFYMASLVISAMAGCCLFSARSRKTGRTNPVAARSDGEIGKQELP